MGQDLFGNSARTRLERIATAARTLHKALIDATQRDYEKSHGRVTNPYLLFSLVANDPAFAWLQPMTRAIVEVEDLAGRLVPAPAEDDVTEARKKLVELLGSEGQPFADRYHALIQGSPDVAVEDGRFHAALREITGKQ
jgi:hypothetical protein